jgi:hypothetical protein
MMWRRIGVMASLTVLAISLTAGPARAEERVCRGTIGAITVDNLRVPQGASCTLNGTKVEGTVKVETSGKLVADEIRVIGNVQAENSAKVVLRDSRVNGSVQLEQGAKATVRRNVIGGNLQLKSNDAALVAVANDIGADLQAFSNKGGVTIRRNVIDGNLQCKENNPAPIGGGNIVHGNKEDQCSKL